MIITGRKLKRLIEAEERIESRIAQLQEELKSVRESKRKEEELEMVRSIRSLKLGGRELSNLLEAIQDGSVSLEPQHPEGDGQEEDTAGRDSAESTEETENRLSSE